MEKTDQILDLFEREQTVLDYATQLSNEVRNGAVLEAEEYYHIVKEYGKLLKQLRRVTKLSDRATESLNTYKLSLLDKVHFDPLTEIYNRRYLEEGLSRAIRSLSRSQGFLSVIMADVDFFKKFNDRYGHTVGDECLKLVSRTLHDSITRADDFVARYGGEEFVVVLPNTSESGACTIAKRILENMKLQNIPHMDSEVADFVTISIGVTSSLAVYDQTGEDYIKKADEALYRSKQSGRNRYTYIAFKEESKNDVQYA